MPELPEVQTVVDTLRPKLIGRGISQVMVARQDVLEPEGIDFSVRLVGRTIRSIDRRGKRILFTLDDSNRFFIHLGMSGRLTVAERAEPVAKHTHVILDVVAVGDDGDGGTRGRGDAETRGHGDAETRGHVDAGRKARHVQKRPGALEARTVQLRFCDPRRFGGVWWLGAAECDTGMGPEPLSVRPSQLQKTLARTTRAIKNTLLDQRVLAGLGNIYVDESLFAAGIHPLSAANHLSPAQIQKLNRAIKLILRRAIRHRGSTLRDYRDANGNSGSFQSLHNVYGRAGHPCRVCKQKIQRIVLGGRSTHFCPVCQPAS